ncbi:c-type cytochrome [Amphritea sp. HPY]|uniref:c-type cytochrome n=1 Tax=Amphritea sp. HPY TaxID=3421652 RepID=UPI003D7D6772
MRKTVIATALIFFTAITPQLVSAHGGASGIVKERMDLMDDMKGAVKKVAAIFKGDIEHNPDTIRDAALIIRDHSGDAMTKLFPTDSLSGHSEATPAIWQEWQRFQKLSDRQVKLAQGLYNAADNKGESSQGHMMGSQSMMGSASMMGSDSMIRGDEKMLHMDDPDYLGTMPASMVFKMLTDNCSSCHERYRKEM